MGQYPVIFLEFLWFPLLVFLTERFIVTRFIRTKAQREYVRSKKWLHPNAITSYRYPMGFISVAMLHFGWDIAAGWFFSFWMITDLTDGDIARRCDLSTKAGETLDPLSDKLMYMPPLLYMAFQGLLNPWFVGAFIFFDIVGQLSRFFVQQKAANLFGKAKTFLVVMLLMLTMMELIYGPLPHARILNPLLAICAALALFSAALKIIPNYWYANVLSLMNLVCGLTGIVVILMGHPPIYAFGLVFLGQFLDLFDGRAAERWGSTPKGEIFDDVADGTSFGGTVALIIATSFTDIRYGVLLAIAHLGSTIYRLIRFVIEKRKAGQEGGVEWFSGLPSPGGALVTGSVCLFVGPEWLKALVVLLSVFLMVSRVPYAHFGRAIMPRIPMLVKVVGLTVYMIVVAYSIRNDYYVPAVGILMVASLAYMVSPIWWKKPQEDSG